MSKADRFRAKQKAAGFVQANEWVPSNQRELFRAVAKALREGLLVTIGAVASNQQQQPEAKPEVTNNRDLPPNVDELLKRKEAKRQQKAKQKVASDRQKKAAEKRAQQQREWSAIFNAEGAEQIEVLTPAKVSRYGVKVTSNRVEVSAMRGAFAALKGGIFDRPSSGTETVVIVQTGKTYKRLVFTDWDSGQHTVKGGLGWQLAGPVKARKKKAEAEFRRKIKEYHPDSGINPDPLKFKEAKDQLDKLRGR